MRCDESKDLLDLYLDGELDSLRAREVEQHIEGCPGCEPQLERAKLLRAAVRNSAPYFHGTVEFKSRVRDAIRKEAGVARERVVPATRLADWRFGFRWAAATAVAAVAVFALVTIGPGLWRSNSQDQITAEVLSSHVRSLMVNHLTDVTSTDQHTVKPWFDGKIDFAPPVNDHKADGFPLIGGRLDYLDHHPAAALVYQRRLHYINVFVWPAKTSGNSAVQSESREGYNILHWRQSGMEFWLASDLSTNELQTFAGLLRK